MIAPGETIGILGGGQLGRMLAMAAAQLGYRVHIYSPEADSIAAEVSAAFTYAAWEDAEAMGRLTTSWPLPTRTEVQSAVLSAAWFCSDNSRA